MPAPRHVTGWLLAAALLTGCSLPGQQDPAPSAHAEDAHADLPPALTVPTWDGEAEASARDAATGVMGAFVRSDLDDTAWQAQLQPWFTPGAWDEAYQYVDLAAVPASTLVGGPSSYEVRPVGSGFVAEVDVTTDVGVYTVQLVRDGAGAPWLTEQLTPPDDVAGQ